MESNRDPQPSAETEDPNRLIDAVESLSRQNADLNGRLLEAGNAGHRMKLLREKNQLTELFESAGGLSPARPDPLPDLPVTDRRGMDDLLAREAELERLAQSMPPRVRFSDWYGVISLGLLLVCFFVVLAPQVRSFTRNDQSPLREPAIARAEIEAILAGIGGKESPGTAADTDLQNHLDQIRNAVLLLPKTDDVEGSLQLRVLDVQNGILAEMRKRRDDRD